MSQGNAAPLLGHYERGLIRRKVEQIIGRAGYQPQDRADLEQELLCRLVRGLKAFHLDRGNLRAFVTTVVERAVATIVRDARAAKRAPGRLTSLSAYVNTSDEGPIELATTISSREQDARFGRRRRTAEELAALRIDVARIIARLPEEERDIAERLKTKSVAAVAEDLGIPRTSLNEQVQRLRKPFESMFLKEFF